MVAIRQGDIIEKISFPEGYKVIAREMRSEGSNWIEIKCFKGRSILYKGNMPDFVKNAADTMYRKYNRLEQPQQGGDE